MKLSNPIKRLGQSAFVGGKIIAPSIMGFLISWLVIHMYSPALWGNIVTISLWVFVLGSISSWGSKDYLLVQFSLVPSKINSLWFSSICTRLVLFPLWALLFFLFTLPTFNTGIICLLWLLARNFLYAFDPLIIYKKSFGSAILPDLIGGVVVLVGILINPGIIISEYVFFLLMISDWIKVFFFTIYFRSFFSLIVRPWFNKNHIFGAFPFFFVGFLGLISSRIDQFFVNFYLLDNDRAFYQIFMTLILLVLLVPPLLMTPVLKDLLRSSLNTYRKTAVLLLKTGAVIIPLAVVAIWFLMTYLYQLESTWLHYLGALIFCIPVFIYSPMIYSLYKTKNSISVLISFLTSLGITTILGFILISPYQTVGALFCGAAGQWTLLFTLSLMKPYAKTKEINHLKSDLQAS